MIVGTLPYSLSGASTAYLYSGKDGALLWHIDGASSVAAADDVNRDGIPDVVVGAPNAGSAYVLSGKDGATLQQLRGSAVAGFGASVAGAGDVNQDGFPDLIVGAPGANPGGKKHAGSAFVFSGKDATVIWQFDGEEGETEILNKGDLFGSSVAGAGDTNQDGIPDLIVGAPGADAGGRYEAGSTYVLSGKDGTTLWQFDGTVGAELGSSVDGAGDVNQDGYADVILGAYYARPGGLNTAGSAYVHSGKDGTLLWQFDRMRLEGMGFSVAGAGDLDQDGFPDLAVGVPFNDSAYLFSGKDGGVPLRAKAEDSALGISVAGVGDVDHDGFPDVIMGAPTASPGGRMESGSAYIVSPRVASTGVPYGTGIPGTLGITPKIAIGREAPRIGSSAFAIEVTEALGGSPCLIGGSLVKWEQPTVLGITLYGDFLTPGGFSHWLVMTTGARFVGGVGTATLPIRIPDDPSLVGLTTYWQAFVADFQAPSPVGLSHTGGLAVTVVQ